VSHVVTEEGVAYLYQAGSLEERRDALAAVAKATPIGTRITPRQAERLRRAGLVAYPADLGVDPTLADRSLLAARSIEDLVTWSQGLYRPARPVPGTGRDSGRRTGQAARRATVRPAWYR